MNDYLFKYIFGRPERKHVLLSLVNAVLNDGDDEKPDVIEDLELIDRELDQENAADKGYRLDILGKTKDGRIVNIEVQTTNEGNIYKRSLCYWGRLYNNQLEKGKHYDDACQTIMINLLDFRYFKGTKYHTEIVLADRRTRELEDDNLQLHFIELPKWDSLSRKARNRLERWLVFISNKNRKEVEEIVMEDANIRNAFEAEAVFLSNDTERYLYEMREKADRDEKSRLYSATKKGEERGENRERLRIVKGFLAEGVPVDVICRATGLSAEKVEGIIRNLGSEPRSRN